MLELMNRHDEYHKAFKKYKSKNKAATFKIASSLLSYAGFLRQGKLTASVLLFLNPFYQFGFHGSYRHLVLEVIITITLPPSQ